MNNKKIKTAIIITLVTLKQPLTKTKEYLTELDFLANTWGLKVVKHYIQKLKCVHSLTFIGKGKLEEIALFIEKEEISYAIFDDELSPSQVRNLEKLLSCKILDRSLLILYIFSMRAKTKQAKIQIELAQYQYLLPRLTRMWTHLSSQKGGKSGIHGPGEKELETDKRIIKHKINKLRVKLKNIQQQCITRNKKRINCIRVTLVGYTNVGKSTLMKLLSKSKILCDNKLFATIDATIRKVILNKNSFLLTDTVGFIRKLPHTLIECFKSTLEEIKEADLLLHIIDASYHNYQEQISIVNNTLQEIGAEKIPKILVFNKIDIIKDDTNTILKNKKIIDTVLNSKISKIYIDNIIHDPTIFISAKKEININSLKKIIIEKIEKIKLEKYVD